MTLCEDGHPEIIHNEGWKECPLCGANEEIARARDEILELVAEIKALEKDIDKLESRIE